MLTMFPQSTAQDVSAFLALFGLPGGGEWIVILIIGLLLFGRRLPEVGRSLGRGIVEFKKGVKGIEEEVEDASKDDKPKRKDLPETASRDKLPLGNIDAPVEKPYRVSSAPQEE